MPPPAETSRPAEAARLPRAPSLGAETAVIALGGAIGASVRFAAYFSIRGVENSPDWLPAMTTFGINVLGALALGVLAGRLESRHAHPLLRPFFGVGVLGSFTTFSGLMGDQQVIHLQYGAGHGVLLLLASIVLGWIAYGLGRNSLFRNADRTTK